MEKRILPNALSRILECLRLERRSERPILVLGDLPAAYSGRQMLFVQSPNILPGVRAKRWLDRLRYATSRGIFRRNLRFVERVIVQTETMRNALVGAYPILIDRVEVIGQPAPQWVIESGLRRTGRTSVGGLRLFYPAAYYPHKNHALLAEADKAGLLRPLVERVVVTIEGDSGGTLDYRGHLTPAEILKVYAASDALIFPSLEESYGLPLVEAMTIGLPIVCADRPYARALCSDQAIYFDPSSGESMSQAITLLRARLDAGWWPDWSHQTSTIPRSWHDTASQMLALF